MSFGGGASGAGFGGGDVVRKQIQFAVEATGQQAVDDLRSNVQRLQAAFDIYRSDLKLGAIDTTEFLDRTKGLASGLAAAQDQLRAAETTLKGGFLSALEGGGRGLL
jgi:hypothetical protein